MKKKVFLFLTLCLTFTGCSQQEKQSSSISSENSSSSYYESSSELESFQTSEDSSFIASSYEEQSSVETEITAPLDIYVLEMSGIYGDSIFIKSGNIDILIDAGWDTDGEYVRQFTNEHVTDGCLDLVVVTHPHGDHVGGMSIALSDIDEVANIIDYGTFATTPNSENGLASYESRKKELINEGTIYHSAYECVNNPIYKTLTFNEDFSVEVMNTGNYYTDGIATTSDPNGHSVSLLFKYGDFTFLTQGDLTTKIESKLLLNEPSLSEVTMYKASHHCSAGSNSKALLDVISPKMVVISASRALNYANRTDTSVNKTGVSGHPQADSVQRIYQSKYIKDNLNVYWNMYAGTMHFQTFGKDESVEMHGTGPTRLGYYQTIDGVESKVEGEENSKFSDTVVFKARGYTSYLPNVDNI